MNPILSARFRDLIKKQFGNRLFFHAPLDERAGQQNTRDLIGTKQGIYSQSVFLEAPRVFPGLDAGSFALDGITGRLRNVGEAGDFAFITETSNWQIHVFTKINEAKTQVFLATETVSAASNISDGFLFYSVQLLPASNRMIRFSFVRQGLTNPGASSFNFTLREDRPNLISLVRHNGELSLFVNSVLVPWASNAIGTITTAGPQLYPLSIGCAPAGAESRINGNLQDVLIFKGESLDPQKDVDFIHRAAVRGLSVRDFVSQSHPTCDVFCEFDEAAGGTTLVNRAGDDGTYFGSVTSELARINQRVGKVTNFDGATSYAQLTTDLDYIQKTGVFTFICSFALVQDVPVSRWLAGTQTDSNQTGWQIRVRSDGEVQLRFSDGATFSTDRVVQVGAITTGEPLFLALTGDGTNVRFYWQGLAIGAPQTITIDNVSGSWNAIIAGNSDAPTTFLPAKISLFASIPETLQAHEIQHIYKLLALAGPLAEIPIAQTPLPVPEPEPGDAILAEDGSQILSEDSELILFD